MDDCGRWKVEKLISINSFFNSDNAHGEREREREEGGGRRGGGREKLYPSLTFHIYFTRPQSRVKCKESCDLKYANARSHCFLAYFLLHSDFNHNYGIVHEITLYGLSATNIG